MNNHIKGAQWAAYIDNEMDVDEKKVIQNHLNNCSVCAQEVEKFQELKIRFSRLQHHTAPRQLIELLKNQYSPRQTFAQIFWRPVAAVVVLAAVASIFFIYRPNAEPDYVDLDSLLVAHSKYQAESLVPSADMSQSNYSARLASFNQNGN